MMVRTLLRRPRQLRQDPRTVSATETVATSTELAAQQNLLERRAQGGLHQIGDTEIVKLTVQSVNLDNSDPECGTVPTVTSRRLLGRQRRRRRRQERQVRRQPGSAGHADGPAITVANYEWVTDPTGAWRVACERGPRANAMRRLLILLSRSAAVATQGVRSRAGSVAYADTVCQQTDPPTGKCLIWIEVRATRATPANPVTTGRQTPALDTPAIGTRPSKGSTGHRRGRCPARAERVPGRTTTTAMSSSRSRSHRRATRAGRVTSRETVRSTSAISLRQTW